MNNTLKTTALLGLLTGLLILIGGYFGGSRGMSMAFVMAFIMNFGAYWFSDRIVLAMYRAQPVTEAEAPGLYRVVHGLTLRAQMPMPRIYIIPTEAPNAFATGRDPEHAAVAATHGILRILNEEELEGVMAHELAHVRNRDTLISTIAATLAGVIVMLARMAMWMPYFGGGSRDNEDRGGGAGFLFLAILAPIAATLIQLAISRSREFHADESAARLTHKPYALAAALQKLETGATRLPMEANPATSHLFIVNPLRGDVLFKLFSTHPPIEERIARLRALVA
ncbi:protease [Candidatus Methylomirabilis lanthanidiphila]|uniref:Protease HtpX homolog n=1 Tax=Candidatus Methylomirabilis lanthanidiphila TaxID=2211376 RepID=A0A564ZMT5_9BACT|nr:zinc metalloprotease HtpX [Candidatus Methylomirabilis lanthanidiphila]VUZ86177.1 protease [Candidatus Methylomirabilis lanthanidiphila]